MKNSEKDSYFYSARWQNYPTWLREDLYDKYAARI